MRSAIGRPIEASQGEADVNAEPKGSAFLFGVRFSGLCLAP